MADKSISYEIKSRELLRQIGKIETELGSLYNQYNDCFNIVVIAGINYRDLAQYFNSEDKASEVQDIILENNITTSQIPADNPSGVGSLKLVVNKDKMSENKFNNLISKIKSYVVY